MKKAKRKSSFASGQSARLGQGYLCVQKHALAIKAFIEHQLHFLSLSMQNL
jgi:hypothetical protein